MSICPDMEQGVIVPAFVYNNCLNSQSHTMQELSEYHSSENSTHQIGPHKKEFLKIKFANADYLVDKNLSCPRIKLSKLQTLFLHGVEIEVLLSDFTQ